VPPPVVACGLVVGLVPVGGGPAGVVGVAGLVGGGGAADPGVPDAGRPTHVVVTFAIPINVGSTDELIQN
jgi:hypothetical protein